MKSYPVYLAARMALGTVRRLRRATAARWLDALSTLAFRLDSVHRRIAFTNLTIAFPELARAGHEAIALGSFQSSARNLLEVSHIPRLTSANIGGLVHYDPDCGLNNYELARSGQKGILYLTGHFSAWELLPAAHALYGHPLSFITRPLDNAPLETYLHHIREMAGNRVIYKKNSARRILETLKHAGEVGILMDQNTGLQEGVFADLFGLPAATSTSIALLALRTDAAVLPGYLTPAPEGRYAIKFLEPVELIRTGDTARDIERNTGRFNHILERIIREQPGTWLWGHKRWKYQPEGSPDLYALSLNDLRIFLEKRSHSRTDA